MPRVSTCIALLATLIAGGAGCLQATYSRTGAQSPPHDDNCDVTFDIGDLSKTTSLLDAGYVHVGDATLVHAGRGDAWTDKMRAEVGPKVCEFGGDVALLSTSSLDRSADGGEIHVKILRKPAAMPAPAGTEIDPSSTAPPPQ